MYDDLPPRVSPEVARKQILADALHMDCPEEVRHILIGDPAADDDGFQSLSRLIGKPGECAACGRKDPQVTGTGSGVFVWCEGCGREGERGDTLEEAIQLWNDDRSRSSSA